MFNLATTIEQLDNDSASGAAGGILDAYGGTRLHEQSHAESFLAIARHRFRGAGLYLLDEPEAALAELTARGSPVLALLDHHVQKRG